MELEHDRRGQAPLAPTRSPSGATGYAWLAGGTWLFSEPQVKTTRSSISSRSAGRHCSRRTDGLEIAATCRIVELDRFSTGAGRRGRRRRCSAQCCRSFLASFKIWNEATVGGNICMSLPAGPMISLTAALEGVYTLWPRERRPRQRRRRRLRDRQPRRTCSRPGELLRSIHLPAAALAQDASPSAAPRSRISGDRPSLLIGTRCREARRSSAHRHGRDRRARCSSASSGCPPPTSCAARIDAAIPDDSTSTTSTGRRLPART